MSLERVRAFHEDLEAYEKAIIKQLEAKPKTHKERVLQQHRVANLLKQAVERSKALHDLYADEDSALKDEIAAMRGKDAFKNFYSSVENTLQYHARNPNVQVQHGPNVGMEMEPKVAFSGEEVFGKFFDLHSLFQRWINLPQCRDKHMDYSEYLATLPTAFSALSEAEKRRNNGKPYVKYVSDLGDYLEDFLARTQPLVDMEDVLGEAKSAFEQNWKAGTVPGWAKDATAAAPAAAAERKAEPRALDLSKYHSMEELQPLGMDRLREALEALGLKCGGTLQQRADRLWSVRGVPPEQIDPKLRAKKPKSSDKGKATANRVGSGGAGPANGDASTANCKKRQRNGGAEANGAEVAGEVASSSANGNSAKSAASSHEHSSGDDARRELAWGEERVRALLGVLTDVLEATRRQVEKKQTLTVEERDAEMREEEEGVLPEIDEMGDDDSDDDGPIYNPLNLPLGWDGKPIPYWLYKLHGLGVEFKCEICGGFSYMGRRNFDRHFQEWRHAHGMRCLGIPNTKHFHDITLIQDAQDLYSKIRHQLDKDQWNPEAEEEYEDAQGNVLKRRTYEDLARQGLL